jgi:hypothetical protein
MMGFLASMESSQSPEQMEFCGNFLSKWNFLGISFGRLLARIAEYLLNGSPKEVKLHKHAPEDLAELPFLLPPQRQLLPHQR